MSTINILGIDIGKFTFHLVGHDSSGREVCRKKLSRPKLIQFLANTECTTVAMESCGGSHWLARKCQELGHKVRLIPPQYVQPYVKTNKNDFIDADAIAEAVFGNWILSLLSRKPFNVVVIALAQTNYVIDIITCNIEADHTLRPKPS